MKPIVITSKKNALFLLSALLISCSSQAQQKADDNTTGEKNITQPMAFPAKPGLTVMPAKKSNEKQNPPAEIPERIQRELIENNVLIKKQEAKYWCWAACVQSLLAQRGKYHSQSTIAAQLNGFPWDKPTSLKKLYGLLEQYGFKAVRTGRPATKRELLLSFMQDKKIIAYVEQDTLSAVGHSVLLQGYDDDLNIYVSDPATGYTMQVPIDKVYEHWNWLDAIVVSKK